MGRQLTFGQGWISLDYLKRYPTSRRSLEWLKKDTVRIWSNEHCLYWRANRSGYTSDIREAGIYTFKEAYAATNHCGSEKGITYRSPEYSRFAT